MVFLIICVLLVPVLAHNRMRLRENPTAAQVIYTCRFDSCANYVANYNICAYNVVLMFNVVCYHWENRIFVPQAWNIDRKSSLCNQASICPSVTEKNQCSVAFLRLKIVIFVGCIFTVC